MEPIAPLCTCGTATSVASGLAVLMLSEFAQPQEVATLLSAGEAAAVATDATQGRLRLHVQRLDAAVQSLSEELVARALAFVQMQLPGMGEAMLKCSAGELGTLPLEFSPGEPAVNVYGVGGEFAAHEDRMGLTILLTLSPPEAFTGGGTAFWEPQKIDEARKGAKPSRVLAPPAGTALLFAGEVTHAALPVGTGSRSVWVASFSVAEAARTQPTKGVPMAQQSGCGMEQAPGADELDAFLEAVGVT